MVVSSARSGNSRTRGYHHGNLAEALLEAGVELARTGGPDAVVLRGAARLVGVSPTAAYRHFKGQTALLDAVRARALEELAEHLSRAAAGGGLSGGVGSGVVGSGVVGSGGVGSDGAGSGGAGSGGAGSGSGDRAGIGRLEAVGRAYLEFALGERGLFRTCLGLSSGGNAGSGGDDGPEDAGGADRGSGPHDGRGDGGRYPDVRAFGVLTDVVQELVADGLIDRSAGATAPVAAWAAVHGLSILCLDGPLAGMPTAEREAVFQATLHMVLDGLLTRP